MTTNTHFVTGFVAKFDDAAAVGRHYGSRSADGVLDLWVMDSADAASAAELETGGLRVAVTGLLMSSPDATAEFVRLAAKALPRNL